MFHHFYRDFMDPNKTNFLWGEISTLNKLIEY